MKNLIVTLLIALTVIGCGVTDSNPKEDVIKLYTNIENEIKSTDDGYDDSIAYSVHRKSNYYTIHNLKDNDNEVILTATFRVDQFTSDSKIAHISLDDVDSTITSNGYYKLTKKFSDINKLKDEVIHLSFSIRYNDYNEDDSIDSEIINNVMNLKANYG